MKNTYINPSFDTRGLFTLSLRWVIGWTYFSAFWRRLILENKLIPDEAGYIGEKFNHFLPNALGIQPVIEHLVTHPDQLEIAMIVFTIVEAIVGLFLILGLFTRIMSIGVLFLALGILLGSGWIGTTCLDEWQIGVLGISGGFSLFLTGSGMVSMDGVLLKKKPKLSQNPYFIWLASGPLHLRIHPFAIILVSIFIFMLTLFTNQYFHGGVWGTLHNKSVKPKIEITDVYYDREQVHFQIYRTEGADVYGSFLIGIEVLDHQENSIQRLSYEELSSFPKEHIKNIYVAKVKPGEHSLIIPLGAKASISLPVQGLENGKNYQLKLTDISGITWNSTFRVSSSKGNEAY